MHMNELSASAAYAALQASYDTADIDATALLLERVEAAPTCDLEDLAAKAELLHDLLRDTDDRPELGRLAEQIADKLRELTEGRRPVGRC